MKYETKELLDFLVKSGAITSEEKRRIELGLGNSMIPTANDKLISKTEVAKLLGFTTRTIDELVKRKALKKIVISEGGTAIIRGRKASVGGRVRFKLSDVNYIIQHGTRQTQQNEE